MGGVGDVCLQARRKLGLKKPKSYLQATPKNCYPFESQRCTPFTVRWVVQAHRDQAGIVQHVHPHLFRRQMLTYLTAQGLAFEPLTACLVA
jgi:site-specific recombinase XerD